MIYALFVLKALIALGAALRLTRLVTTDKLPELLVIQYIRKAAKWKQVPTSWSTLGVPVAWDDEPTNFAGYLIELASCSFCTSVYATALCVLVEFLAPTIWPSIILGVFALSYLVGHLSHRFDA